MAAMRHDDVAEAARPVLRALEGGRKADRRTAAEFAHVELMTFFSEVETAAEVIVNAVVGLPVPSTLVINEASRLAFRAGRAREEWLALTDGPDVA